MVPSLPFELTKTATPLEKFTEDLPDVASVIHVLTNGADTDNVTGRSHVTAAPSPKAILPLPVVLNQSAP